jgi:hypothetical protein
MRVYTNTVHGKNLAEESPRHRDSNYGAFEHTTTRNSRSKHMKQMILWDAHDVEKRWLVEPLPTSNGTNELSDCITGLHAVFLKMGSYSGSEHIVF